MEPDNKTVDMVVQVGETEENNFDDMEERTPTVFLGEQRVVIKYCVYGDNPTDTISIAVSIPREQLVQALPLLRRGSPSRLGDNDRYARIACKGGPWCPEQQYYMNMVNPGNGANIRGLVVNIPEAAMKKMTQYVETTH